ncbi:MAG: T9SS type A sorting domain-containing protein [Brumimicrobium sp.]
MKRIFTFSLVTMMLLSFSLTSNSQTTFGCPYPVGDDGGFNLDNFTTEGQTIVEEVGCKVKLTLWNEDNVIYKPQYEGQTNNVILEFTQGTNFSEFNVSFYNDGNEVIFNYNPSNDIVTIQVNDYIKNPKIVFNEYLTSGPSFGLKSVTFEGENVVNITNETLDETFNVYNYNNTLTVETSEFEDYNLEIYNLSGRLVFSENTSGNFKTNLSENGFYIVKLRYENQVLTKKVIVQ